MLRKIGKIRGKGLGLRVADDEEENYRFYYIWWLEVNQCDYCPLRGQLGKCYHFLVYLLPLFTFTARFADSSENASIFLVTHGAHHRFAMIPSREFCFT